MASEEHQELANFIKSVHKSLRIQSQRIGPTEAWKKHCTQTDVLQKYASAMHLLATKFWQHTSDKSSDSRIHWVVNVSIDYFLNDGRISARYKESTQQKFLSRSDYKVTPDLEKDCDIDIFHSNSKTKVRLLDVGSCYNPFKDFALFEVLPVDLMPASSDVWKCDFLSAEIISSVDENWKVVERHIAKNQIVANFFDVVVFSLFLEYIPCPNERYNCCVKAYKILKSEGLLFIITPDSKHATANAPIMKQWRIILGNLGFCRIHYEKLSHLHCMAFRKSIEPKIPQLLASKIAQKTSCLLTLNNNLLHIPQDMNGSTIKEQKPIPLIERNDSDNAVLVEMFSELPEV